MSHVLSIGRIGMPSRGRSRSREGEGPRMRKTWMEGMEEVGSRRKAEETSSG
jgi:hypothetical protein